MQKVNPSELASFELLLNFFLVYNFILIMLPIRKTWHFLKIKFIPEILLKLSKISTSVSNDFSELSRIKDASSAKRDF